MTKDQRARLIGLIYEYGNEVARMVKDGNPTFGSPAVVMAIGDVLAVLDEVMVDRPSAGVWFASSDE